MDFGDKTHEKQRGFIDVTLYR